jgi:hypothetical protein
MDFGNALNALRAGHKVSREKWAAGYWLKIEDEVIVRSTGRSSALEDLISLDASDLLATDWEIVDG